MQLDLQIQNGQRLFGPYDIVQGTVSLTTPGNVLISEISVKFTGRSAYSFSPYLIVDSEHALEQTLISQKSGLYASEKTNPKPPLPAVRHEWPFRFRFPAKETSLPPSFGHAVDTSQTLAMGYWSRRTVRSTCYVLYNLTAHLGGTDLPKQCPRATKVNCIFFWPNRYTELPDGPLPKAHRHSISIPQATPLISFQKDQPNILQRLRKKISQTKNFDVLDLVANIPRYTILGQPIQVSLSTSTADGMHESRVLTLVSVHYALYAITRIGRRTSSRRHISAHTALEQHIENIGTPFLEPDNCIRLHNTAPVIPSIRAGWSTVDGITKGPLCPTFESELIARTYTLSLGVTVSFEGCPQTRWFKGGEIVLLPHRLDASVKKRSLMEMDGEGMVEAGGNAVLSPELAADSVRDASRVEADGGDVAHEVDDESGRRGQELPVVDAVIEKRIAKGSSELESDMPIRAESATTTQQ